MTQTGQFRNRVGSDGPGARAEGASDGPGVAPGQVRSAGGLRRGESDGPGAGPGLVRSGQGA
jgi:hypothetical protein